MDKLIRYIAQELRHGVDRDAIHKTVKNIQGNRFSESNFYLAYQAAQLLLTKKDRRKMNSTQHDNRPGWMKVAASPRAVRSRFGADPSARFESTIMQFGNENERSPHQSPFTGDDIGEDVNPSQHDRLMAAGYTEAEIAEIAAGCVGLNAADTEGMIQAAVQAGSKGSGGTGTATSKTVVSPSTGPGSGPTAAIQNQIATQLAANQSGTSIGPALVVGGAVLATGLFIWSRRWWHNG